MKEEQILVARDPNVFANTIPLLHELYLQENWCKLVTKRDFLLWTEWPESALEICVDFWSVTKVASKPEIPYP